MISKAKERLIKKVNDDKLVENLFDSFQKISEEYVSQKPIELLQNTGLFIESAMRVAEHLVIGDHTPLEAKFDLNACIEKLENLPRV